MLRIRSRTVVGLSADEVCPVFHSTDTYRSSKKRLKAFWKRKQRNRLVVRSNTPRGDAVGVEVAAPVVETEMLKFAPGVPHHLLLFYVLFWGCLCL